MDLRKTYGNQCHTRTLLRNDVIIRDEERGKWVAQILSGSVVVQAHQIEGKHIFLRELRPFEIVGDFNTRDNTDLVCLSEAKVVYVSRAVFMQSLFNQEQAVRDILNQYYIQIMDVERRLRMALMHTVGERIIDELEQRQRSYGMTLPITQNELSMRLGASRETISREIIKLEESGAIYRQQKYYYVVKKSPKE